MYYKNKRKYNLSNYYSIYDNNMIFMGFIQLASDYTLEMEICDIIKQIPNIG